jgi:type II secretory pathway pseudopilin PulG
MSNNKGYSIVEITVVIGIAAVLIVAVSKNLTAIKDLNASSELKTQAAGYAQESLEIITDIKNELFACICWSNGSCVGGTCALFFYPQSCGLFPAYDSCWTEYPVGQTGQNDFSLVPDGTGSWKLNSLGGGRETIATDPRFERQIIITNMSRNAFGELDPSGTPDYNTKKVEVKVWYQERGEEKEFSYKTILTAWENL